MIKQKFMRDVRGKKEGLDFIYLRLPRKYLKDIPESFYMDLEIKGYRDASINPIKLKRKMKGG